MAESFIYQLRPIAIAQPTRISWEHKNGEIEKIAIGGEVIIDKPKLGLITWRGITNDDQEMLAELHATGEYNHLINKLKSTKENKALLSQASS